MKIGSTEWKIAEAENNKGAESMKKWIVYDIFRKVKVEVEAPNFDRAIETARNAYPAPDYLMDTAHVANVDPRHNEPDFELLPIK